MTPLWRSADAEAATGGRVLGAFAATGVSIDSRSLVPGDLFVALADARDGHDFVADALARGAAGALVSRVPEGVAPTAPLLLVEDVQAALTALGRAGRARMAGRVVAITGSVGKTSAKEMLRTALAGQGRVHAAEASHNNHWGVALTLARMPADTDFAVVEIGMNHPGEIAPLARLARPDVALITTVAAAHLEAFDDLAGIAEEKATILGGLAGGGTAVLNADLETTPILTAAAARAGARPVTFGRVAGADYRLDTVRAAAAATVVQATGPEGPVLFKLAAPGEHLAMNGLGVLATAGALGADPALATLGLAEWAPPAGRGTRERVALDPAAGDAALDLIDDAFNANPASMAAALAVLAAAEPATAAGRRVAILGDMLELGPGETALHAALAGLPSMGRIDLVHCVGPRMRALWERLPAAKRGECVAEAGALARQAHRQLRPGDVVLVKGSKASAVSGVVDAIRKLGDANAIRREDPA